MKRQSSNKVKTLKIAASATKQTRKLSARERKRVASIRFGKPRAENHRCLAKLDFASGSDTLELRDRLDTDDTKGIRLTSRNSKLKPKMNTVASHGPTYGDTVFTRASDSPRSEMR